MKYATASAFRSAMEQRLARHARETGVPLVRLRKLVVFNRLIARPMGVAPNRWVLKGAMALQFRVGPRFRTTKDMDLGRQDSEEAATVGFLAAQSVDVGDHFTFAVERTGRLDPAVAGVAMRYHATAQLAGRRFEDVTGDVGLGDPAVQDPELIRGPELLGFADIPPAEVPALPLEQHVTKKVHAYTRRYVGGSPSTRVKDMVDLAVTSSLFHFQAGRLRRKLEAALESRGTHELPSVSPPPSPGWRTPYRRMLAEVGLEPDLSSGYKQARAFLDPILAGTTPEQTGCSSLQQAGPIAWATTATARWPRTAAPMPQLIRTH